MADFTRLLPAEQAPSYIGLSKETDKAKVDESLGTLFKGVGNVVDVTTKALDDRNINKIQEDLYKGIDSIRGAQGVDSAVADQSALIPPEGNKGTTPPAVGQATSEIQRLQAAYADGSIGDSYYWSKVEALTRQVRARYPGYREEIDKKVSHITGTTPANALRSSLLSDLATAASKKNSAEDKFDSYWKSNLDSIDEGTRQKLIAGDRSPAIQSQVYDTVGKVKLNATAVQTEKNDLLLKKERNTFNQDEATGVATREVNGVVDSAFNKAAGAATGGGDLMAKIQGLVKDGKALSPEEQQSLSSSIALLRSKTSADIDALFNKPLREGSEHTYASLIRDPTRLNQIKEQALARINNMEQLLINKEFGLFASNANMAKASQDYTTRKLLETSEAARKMQAGRAIMGDAFGVYLSQNPAQISEMAKALNDLSFAELVTNDKTTINQQLERLKGALGENQDPAAYRAQLETTTSFLKDDKAKPESLSYANSKVYSTEGPSFLSQFRVAQQSKVYAQLTTPEITANMRKLGETDPAAWERYKTWAGTNFYAVYKETMSNLARVSEMGMDLSIKVGDDGKLVVVDMNPKGMPNLRNDGRENITLGEAMMKGPRTDQLQRQAEHFNRGIDSLAPIIGAEGGKIVEALGAVYNELGITPPKDGKINSENPGESRFKSLGNTIQLAKYTPEENSKVGMRDKDLINIEGEREKPIDLEGDKPGKGPVSTGKYAPVLNLLGRAEGPKGYNQIVGNNRSAPLSDMTIQEVFDLQSRMVASGSESSAVGRYQFIKKTLQSTVAALGLDPATTKFDGPTQDRLAVALVGKALRGYEKGTVSKDELADTLAGSWAGLPLASGLSRYHGVGSNKATVTRKMVMDAIDQLTVD